MVWKYKRRIERIEGTDPPTENVEICAINTPTKTREKTKFNGIFLNVQINSGSDITLKPRNLLEKMGKF